MPDRILVAAVAALGGCSAQPAGVSGPEILPFAVLPAVVAITVGADAQAAAVVPATSLVPTVHWRRREPSVVAIDSVRAMRGTSVAYLRGIGAGRGVIDVFFDAGNVHDSLVVIVTP